MARLPSRRYHALTFLTNGKRANDAYGLSDLVGRYVGRVDAAKRKAVVSLNRRAIPVTKKAVRAEFNVKPKHLAGRKIFAVYTTDSVRIYASTRRIPLIEFSGRWAGRRSPGATASILPGQVVVYPQSFIRTVNGLRSIRVRQSLYAKRAPRGPLQMLYGPSVREMIDGRRRDPEKGHDDGFYPKEPGKEVLAELQTFYVAELRRLIAVESSRG